MVRRSLLHQTLGPCDDDDQSAAEPAPSPTDPVRKTLLENRVLILGSEVNAKTASRLIEQLLYLDLQDPEAPITLYINSPGGEIASGLAIYDIIRRIRPRVVTVCAGLTASIATIILLGANKGDRKALPNARLLIHQPLGGFRGAATEIEIHAREMLKTKQHVNNILAEATGQPLERIEEDTNRDYWMSTEEALEYGLIDEILHGPAKAD